MNAKPIVAALDPGQARAGFVVRQGDKLREHALLTRDGRTLQQWCDHVAAHVVTRVIYTGCRLTAIESTKAPNPHVGRRRKDGTDRGARIIDPTPVLEATAVAWAVYGWLRSDDVVMVEPAGFSATVDERVDVLRQLFPPELVTTPKDALRDCRAAWLVAEAALLQQRVEAAS